MKTVLHEFLDAFREGPRMFFAPLVGAWNAVKLEIQRSTDRDLDAVEATTPKR
jgi:hypothetical protein